MVVARTSAKNKDRKSKPLFDKTEKRRKELAETKKAAAPKKTTQRKKKAEAAPEPVAATATRVVKRRTRSKGNSSVRAAQSKDIVFPHSPIHAFCRAISEKMGFNDIKWSKSAVTVARKFVAELAVRTAEQAGIETITPCSRNVVQSLRAIHKTARKTTYHGDVISAVEKLGLDLDMVFDFGAFTRKYRLPTTWVSTDRAPKEPKAAADASKKTEKQPVADK